MHPSESAVQRAAEVVGFDPAPPRPHGYVDLLDAEPAPTGLAQRLMGTRLVPAVYERWWRPALARLVKGPSGPSMAEELRAARRLLAVTEGAVVLDVACGPGNVTRALAADAGAAGTVVGVDVSATMLARAVAATRSDHVVYVRGDVTDLAVGEARVDAVCCFAALHLFADPWAALDTMTRALAPGGRLAILTSVRPRTRPGARAAEMAGALSGMRIFGSEELADALAARGCELTAAQRFGVIQLVAARKDPQPR